MLISRHWIASVVAIMILIAAGCGSKDLPAASISGDASRSDQTGNSSDTSVNGGPLRLTVGGTDVPSPARPQGDLYPVVILNTSMGDIKIRLDAQKAPRTVDNFLSNYVDRGVYDGTIFHYVEADYMVAAGGFTSNYDPLDVRSPIYNECDNGLSNKSGTVAMAHHPDYVHSATSQFFVNVVDNPSLDYQAGEEDEITGYCVFGEVIEGMDVVKRISQVAVQDRENFPNSPVEPVIIRKASRVP